MPTSTGLPHGTRTWLVLEWLLLECDQSRREHALAALARCRLAGTAPTGAPLRSEEHLGIKSISVQQNLASVQLPQCPSHTKTKGWDLVSYEAHDIIIHETHCHTLSAHCGAIISPDTGLVKRHQARDWPTALPSAVLLQATERHGRPQTARPRCTARDERDLDAHSGGLGAVEARLARVDRGECDRPQTPEESPFLTLGCRPACSHCAACLLLTRTQTRSQLSRRGGCGVPHTRAQSHAVRRYSSGAILRASLGAVARKSIRGGPSTISQWGPAVSIASSPALLLSAVAHTLTLWQATPQSHGGPCQLVGAHRRPSGHGVRLKAARGVSRQAHGQAAHECVRLHLTALAARYARAMVRGSSPRASTSFKALLFLTRVSRVSQSISEARVGLAVTQCETRFLCAPLRPSSDTHADQAQKVQPVLNFDSSAVNRSCCVTGLTRQLGGWNTFVRVYNFQCCLALSIKCCKPERFRM